MKKAVLGLCCAALCVGFAISSTEARPLYYVQFKKTYPDIEGFKEAKCNTCHEGKDKKNNNNYGDVLKAELPMENVKDKEEIEKALKAIEDKPSAIDGKTFGDLLKAKKLPASKE